LASADAAEFWPVSDRARRSDRRSLRLQWRIP